MSVTWVLKPDCPHSYLISCHVSLRTVTFLGLSFLHRGACDMLICHLVSLILNEVMFSVDLLNCAFPNWFHSESVLEAVCGCGMVTQVVLWWAQGEWPASMEQDKAHLILLISMNKGHKRGLSAVSLILLCQLFPSLWDRVLQTLHCSPAYPVLFILINVEGLYFFLSTNMIFY